MEHIEVNNALLERYVLHAKRHQAHKETVSIAEHLAFHIDGYVYKPNAPTSHNLFNTNLENQQFKILIDERRPSESIAVRDYRRKIYRNKTKSPCFKVINSLKKIVKTEEWQISYKNSDVPTSLPETDTLEVYAETKYPFFKSVENWLYTSAMKEFLTDPNGVFSVVPVNLDATGSEFFKPFSFFTRSIDVLDFIEDELAVLRTNESKPFLTEGGRLAGHERVLMFLTRNEVFTATKLNTANQWRLELRYTHNLDNVPAWRAGGTPKGVVENAVLYDSFLSPMLPSLDEAAREYSDLQAEVVQHIHSQIWYISTLDCTPCNGTGRIQGDAGEIICTDCKGAGTVQKNPFNDLVLKPGQFGQDQVPVPPMGYVEKNTEIVKVQDERIEGHIFQALSSLNMEFLAKTPLNQSGKAKQVDREELNNFVFGVAWHVVENIVKPVYWFINEMRYQKIVPNDKTRRAMLPHIPVPGSFDLLDASIIEQQLATARDSGADNTIINELELDYTTKKFKNQPLVRMKIKAIKRLDPFAGRTDEQVDNALLTGRADKLDAVLSMYVEYFVNQAIEKDPEFLRKSFEEQDKAVRELALAKLNANADRIAAEIPGVPPTPPDSGN